MISTSILSFVASLAPAVPAVPAPATVPAVLFQDEAGPGFDERYEAAGDDVAKLWALHEWCREQHKYSESRKTLKRIVELSPEHAEARAALGHTFYDGQWFESSYKLSEHKRAEEKRMLDEKGLVRFGDEWIPKDDAPFVRMGWVKDDSGTWSSKLAARRAEEAAKHSAEGWKQQTDGVWVAPADQGKWEQGLWLCGDQWLPAAEANAYHGDILKAWRWPTKYFVLYSTLDYPDGLGWAAYWADLTFPDLVRAYGVKPQAMPIVTVMNSVAQYNTLASGDQGRGIPPTEANGYSSCHYAYVGETWVDVTEVDPSDPAGSTDYLGGGITYWDRNDPNLRAYGVHAVRHAAALSYAEAIDPSWEAISTFASNPQGGQAGGFWTEKRIPRWYRFGVASYCERFFKDENPSEGYGPWWARDWALDNIRREGGPRPFEQIFAFNLDPNQQKDSGKLIAEAGMLVSFVLDGNCGPVKEKHAAFKAALREGGDIQAAIEELQQAILANDEPFHMHAGM
jgi:hypothetical protein